MYKEQMVAAVKVGGKVLRENGETVVLPFGSEYSVYLKNLNTVRAMVHVEIDGRKVTGDGLVLYGGQSIDLERFLDNGNLDAGNRLKFIERSAAVEAHRGVGTQDGLVRVSFEFERRPAYVPPPVYSSILRSKGPTIGSTGDDSYLSRQLFNSTSEVSYSASIAKGESAVASASAAGEVTAQAYLNAASSAELSAAPQARRLSKSSASPAPGITVEGAVSRQQFHEAAWFPLDGVKHEPIVLRLLGQVGGAPVEAPVTTRTKAVCPSCGAKNDAFAKFCGECGTGLQVV